MSFSLISQTWRRHKDLYSRNILLWRYELQTLAKQRTVTVEWGQVAHFSFRG